MYSFLLAEGEGFGNLLRFGRFQNGWHNPLAQPSAHCDLYAVFRIAQWHERAPRFKRMLTSEENKKKMTDEKDDVKSNQEAEETMPTFERDIKSRTAEREKRVIPVIPFFVKLERIRETTETAA